MELFLNVKPEPLEKEAGTPIKLSDDDAKWPQEITAEVFRSFPSLGGADVRVELTRTEPSTGVGVGRVIIRRAPARADMPTPEGAPVILPVVIRGGQLEPMDIATDGGNYFPATPKRLEQLLVGQESVSIGPRPEDLVDDTSYFSDLIPPGRNYHGAYPGVGVMKTGGAPLSLGALKRASADMLTRMRTEIASDPATFLSLQVHAPLFISKLGSAEPHQPEKVNVWDQLPPPVFQIEKLGYDRVRVSYANRLAFLKQAQEMPTAQAEQMFPEQMMPQDPNQMQQAPPEGAPPADPNAEMLGAEPGMEEGMEAPAFSTEAPVNIPTLPRLDPTSPIKEPGEYLVFDGNGKSFSGWGCGHVYTFDEQDAGMTVFSNGAISAYQPAIAGAKTGTGFLPPTTRFPQGFGCFIVRIDGELRVYEPVQLLSNFSTPDGRGGFVCQTMQGAQVSIQAIPEVRRMTPMGEGVYALPERYEFLSLEGFMPLLQPGQIIKQATVALDRNPLYLSAPAMDLFNLEGTPVAELPEAERMGINKKAAHFLLVTCGVHPRQSAIKLAEAERLQGDVVPIPRLRPITYGPPLHQAAMHKAASARGSVSEFPRFLLAKDAAIVAGGMSEFRAEHPRIAKIASGLFKTAFSTPMPEYETVDSILSLGLINRDSVDVFLRQREQLEQALSTLCSLLLFSRLGAPSIPEISLERCIQGFEETLEALKALPFHVE